MKRICRNSDDTEVVEIGVRIECPYCGEEWIEVGVDSDDQIHIITCDNSCCEKLFELDFSW